jgi:para-aminobenzoate synthetase component 1
MIRRVESAHSPESLAQKLSGLTGTVLLHSGESRGGLGRYSLVTAWPFLSFRSWGALCELHTRGRRVVQYGDPWQSLAQLMARYETLDPVDAPFPLGGCFGVWGYDLKSFLEPRVGRRAVHDLALPDCDLGFHDSLVVFDHQLNAVWIISTGLQPDGSRSRKRARVQFDRWRRLLDSPLPTESEAFQRPTYDPRAKPRMQAPESSLSREAFLSRVQRAQAYIRAGDIYQVNLAHRLCSAWSTGGWDLYRRLSDLSPAPFAAWMKFGDYTLVSSSPELFLKMTGPHVETQPIKGTRPRGADATHDAQLGYELQTSAKERAELLMITDLLRNDLGRVCEYGSVRVEDLMRLERFAQVQHLVSTVEGTLRPKVSHFQALTACFPGGSITGAPKIRAMQIIDELEPVSRGPYTGALGYLGFNRETQVSIAIRVAVVKGVQAYYHAGAGIVADSDPMAEYEETLAKAAAFQRLGRLACPMPAGNLGL